MTGLWWRAEPVLGPRRIASCHVPRAAITPTADNSQRPLPAAAHQRPFKSPAQGSRSGTFLRSIDRPKTESSRGERGASRAGSGLFVALVLWGMAFFFGPQCGTGCVQESACAFPGHGTRRAGGLVEVTCFEAHGQAPALEGAARLLFGLPLDLNRADSIALESLPSIGPARAGAIVGERCRDGFENLEALVRVHGIGRRTVEGLRGWAVAESAPVCPRADSRPE